METLFLFLIVGILITCCFLLVSLLVRFLVRLLVKLERRGEREIIEIIKTIGNVSQETAQLLFNNYRDTDLYFNYLHQKSKYFLNAKLKLYTTVLCYLCYADYSHLSDCILEIARAMDNPLIQNIELKTNLKRLLKNRYEMVEKIIERLDSYGAPYGDPYHLIVKESLKNFLGKEVTSQSLFDLWLDLTPIVKAEQEHKISF